MGKIDVVIRQILSEPKRASEVVKEVCSATGKDRATVFYWLKKLRTSGKIRKRDDGKYELIRLEEASKEEIEFVLEKLKSPIPEVRKEARQEFLTLAGEKKVVHHEAVRKLIEDLLEEEDIESWELALDALNYISYWFAIVGGEETLKWLLTFHRPPKGKKIPMLATLALDGRLDDYHRSIPIRILDRILKDEDHFEVIVNLLTSLVEERAKTNEPLRMPETVSWRILLGKHFPSRKLELKKRLYGLLTHTNRRTRELSSYLLAELRLLESGYHLHNLTKRPLSGEEVRSHESDPHLSKFE